jgi:hypothetical protein
MGQQLGQCSTQPLHGTRNVLCFFFREGDFFDRIYNPACLRCLDTCRLQQGAKNLGCKIFHVVLYVIQVVIPSFCEYLTETRESWFDLVQPPSKRRLRRGGFMFFRFHQQGSTCSTPLRNPCILWFGRQTSSFDRWHGHTRRVDAMRMCSSNNQV